jgi:hypothetical protein
MLPLHAGILFGSILLEFKKNSAVHVLFLVFSQRKHYQTCIYVEKDVQYFYRDLLEILDILKEQSF